MRCFGVAGTTVLTPSFSADEQLRPGRFRASCVPYAILTRASHGRRRANSQSKMTQRACIPSGKDELVSRLADEEAGLFYRRKRDDQPLVTVVLDVRVRRATRVSFFTGHFAAFLVLEGLKGT